MLLKIMFHDYLESREQFLLQIMPTLPLYI